MIWILAMITNQCNLKCKLCNIWREKNKELDTAQLYKVLLDVINNDSKISCLGVTGGEPFLKPKKLEIIFKLIKPELDRSNIKHFNVTTNGSFPLRISSFLKKIPRNYHSKISINLSLDGLAKTHNYLRGEKIFKKVILALNILKKFSIDTTINFVINPFNSNQIFNVYKLSLKMKADFELEIFNPDVKSYYHYFDKVTIEKGNQNWRWQAAGEIEKILAENEDNFSRKQLLVLKNYLKSEELNKKIISGCKTPSNLLFIRATGEVYSCPHESAIDRIENFRYQNFLKKQKKMILKIKNKGCKGCLSTMGALSYVG